MSASRLGGFYGVYDPKGVRQDIGREVSSVHMSSFGESPESVCCFSRDGVEGLFWGELYDYPPGNKAHSIADRILTGYRAHGADFAGQLDGIFALALWDKRAHRLLLFRDSSAARSLYYHQDTQGRMHFSTQLGYLVQQIRPSLSRKGLWEFLRFLEVAPPNTLYEGLSGLEAGHRLIANSSGINVHPVKPIYEIIQRVADYEDAVSQLDVLLQNAVETRMAGSVSVGAFLSGGIDSALICALANFIDKGRVHAVTVGFHEASYDESIVAGRIANHLGIGHEVVRFERSDYLNAMERLYSFSEQPTADPAGLSTLMAFEHCQGRFDTMLDGSGAEALVGMMPARHTRLAIQYATLLPRGLRLGLAPLAGRVPILRDYQALYDFDEPEELLIRWQGFTRQEIERLCDETVSFDQTHFYQVFRSFPRSAHFERYSALLGAMTDDRICHAASLTGVSARFPFIDRRIEGFVHSLPQYMRFAENQEKRILRDILARYVPRQIWDSPKHGFDFPFQVFLAADNYALARMYIESDTSPLVELFQPDCMRSYLKRFIAGDTSLAFKIWTFVVLAIWLNGHEACLRH